MPDGPTMFDLRDPVLVFNTQTHHPVLEHHTGYIFDFYAITARKARPLFFTHIWEAHVFALRMRATLEMNPDAKPDIVTALDYILSTTDGDSRYPATPSSLAGSGDTRPSNWSRTPGVASGRGGFAGAAAAIRGEPVPNDWDDSGVQPSVGSADPESLGRSGPAIDPDHIPTLDDIDWFGD